MHPNANKENTSTSDVQENFVRITRSRAKKTMGGGVSIPPTKPTFKQVLKHVLIESHKRIEQMMPKSLLFFPFVYQQKRRAVLKDVSNTSADNVYSELLKGGNIKVNMSDDMFSFSWLVYILCWL